MRNKWYIQQSKRLGTFYNTNLIRGQHKCAKAQKSYFIKPEQKNSSTLHKYLIKPEQKHHDKSIRSLPKPERTFEFLYH